MHKIARGLQIMQVGVVDAAVWEFPKIYKVKSEPIKLSA